MGHHHTSCQVQWYLQKARCETITYKVLCQIEMSVQHTNCKGPQITFSLLVVHVQIYLPFSLTRTQLLVLDKEKPLARTIDNLYNLVNLFIIAA